MSDQAQGLRALADQVRGDHSSPSSLPASLPGDVLLPMARPANAVSVLSDPAPLVGRHDISAVDGRPHRGRIRSHPNLTSRILAITSGKGGVGKSNFSTNLSLGLVQLGQRIIMLDADLGLANLHLLLGTIPEFSLEHVMQGKKTLSQVLHTAPCGVQLIAGGSGIPELANMTGSMRKAFITGLSELDEMADVIVIDTGAGVARNVLAFLCAVQEIIIITTPEPTAITDAYATIKVVSQENPSARLMLVVNMVSSVAEGEAVSDRLKTIAWQFLQVEMDYLGCIPTDPAVPRAVRNRQPFSLASPDCDASRSIGQIITKLGYRRPEQPDETGMAGLLDRMQHFFGFGGM